MLSEKEMCKIALEECVDMIGRELVMQHKELCCSTCGMEDDGLFHYNLGMDTEEPERPEDPHTIIIDGTWMEYYAYVTVDPNTGEVVRDYESSTLPDKK